MRKSWLVFAFASLVAPALAVAFASLVTPARAQGGDADLAKQLSNPVSSLISVPFQFNYDCCFGAEDGNSVLLNIQPVIPFRLTEDWSLILRTILPVVDQQETVAGTGDHFGLGDTVQSFFLSPTPAPGGII